MDAMRLSRRQLLRLSALAGASAITAGCAMTPAPAGEQQVVKETVIVEVQKAQELTILKMLWRITNPQEEPAMNALWDRFEELNPGVKISPRVFAPYPEVESKIQAWLAASDPPAIFECIAGPAMRYLASRDQCFPLQPLVDRDGYDLSDFYPMTMTLCYYRGELFALPSMTFPTFMMYNVDRFKEVGLDLPPMDWDDKDWNWDTWTTYAAALTEFGSDGKPTKFAQESWGDRRYFTRHFAVEWFNREMLDDGYPKEFAPDKDSLVDVLQFVQDSMYKHRFVPTPAESQEIATGIPLFKTGNFGMQLSSVGGLVGNADITAFEYGLAPIPYPVDRPRWNYAYPDQWYIPKPQKYVDTCWELMKFTVSEEGCKYHPIMSNTAIAPRMSMAGYYASYVMNNLKTEQHKYTRAELDFALKSMDVCETTWAHGSIEYFRYWFEALQPNLELLFNNEMTPDECVEAVRVLAEAIMEETNPDWL